MKIAIPSNDELHIFGHFGRTAGFMICEIDKDKIISKKYKQNTFTGHAQGHHHDSENHGSHSHTGIFNAIGDCDTVIAGGMGRRLYNDFEQKNIQVFVTQEKEIDLALKRFIEKTLDNNSETCCEH